MVCHERDARFLPQAHCALGPPSESWLDLAKRAVSLREEARVALVADHVEDLVRKTMSAPPDLVIDH
ncbi:MAG: hypothetical protein AAF841_14845, partial [Pseudomonadota bacterium]